MTPNREGMSYGLSWITYLEKAIAKIAECKWAGAGHPDYKNESLDDTIKRLYGSDSPDWVLCHPLDSVAGNERWKTYVKPDRPYKVMARMSDMHSSWVLQGSVEEIVKYLNDANFDAIMLKYKRIGYAKMPYHDIDPDYYLKNLKNPICFTPACIDPTIYHPTNEDILYDVIFLGSYERFQYPIRGAILDDLPTLAKQNNWRFNMSSAPLLGNVQELIRKGFFVGDAYVKVLGRSQIFIFDNSIYKYPLLKMFEGMACNTLVMCDMPYSAEELHFLPDHNFIAITLDNWKYKLSYYLSGYDNRYEVKKRGYETVLKYHTCDIRAREVIEWMRKH